MDYSNQLHRNTNINNSVTIAKNPSMNNSAKQNTIMNNPVIQNKIAHGNNFLNQTTQMTRDNQANKRNQANNTKIFDQILQDLTLIYGQDIYISWFAKILFIDIESDGSMILATENNFTRDWMNSNYNADILKIAQKYDSSIRKIDILTNPKLFQNTANDNSTDSINDKIGINANNSKFNVLNKKNQNTIASLDPSFTFDNFVVGPPNELAYESALSIAESSEISKKSNPLFLYGSVGLGKTHLMHAIAWHCHHNYPEKKILYMSAEKFMYSFIKALRDKDIMSFKDSLRSVDVLMIDDIQFICGKESTQEEFFHTFNAIIDNNKQMVISCDRSPSDLDNIEDRIKSRLGWGLVADVHSTTYELRIGILESKLEKMNIKIDSSVIDFLASKITSNVRELEGALNKVIAYSTLVGREITLENTQNTLKDLIRASDKTITISDIQKKVAQRYNIKISDLSSASRIRSIARPRQIAMYLSKKLTSKSLAYIGAKFDKKDHTTVMHAIKKIDTLRNEDIELQEEITLLIKILEK